ncbi:MAG: hypothetical protein KKB50_22345, partial [Planctomycetes bacterium]|nr:hypothetical protein [Planctomycetota bacterium]
YLVGNKSECLCSLFYFLLGNCVIRNAGRKKLLDQTNIPRLPYHYIFCLHVAALEEHDQLAVNAGLASYSRSGSYMLNSIRDKYPAAFGPDIHGIDRESKMSIWIRIIWVGSKCTDGAPPIKDHGIHAVCWEGIIVEQPYFWIANNASPGNNTAHWGRDPKYLP